MHDLKLNAHYFIYLFQYVQPHEIDGFGVSPLGKHFLNRLEEHNHFACVLEPAILFIFPEQGSEPLAVQDPLLFWHFIP